MWFWSDAMQGAWTAAVRALQRAGNAAARRPGPQTFTIYFAQVLGLQNFAIPLVARAKRPGSRFISCTGFVGGLWPSLTGWLPCPSRQMNDIMTPVNALIRIAPQGDLSRALSRLEEGRINQISAAANGKVQELDPREPAEPFASRNTVTMKQEDRGRHV
jgi:hypothetical protein